MRRLGLLGLFLVTLTLMLTACGSKAAIPTFEGAASISVPIAFSDSFKNSTVNNLKNSTITAFKTTEPLSKVKTSLSDSFKQNQWDNATSQIGQEDGLKQVEAAGGFVLGFQKSDSSVAVIGLSNTIATSAGFSGLGPTESVYLVLTGDKA